MNTNNIVQPFEFKKKPDKCLKNILYEILPLICCLFWCMNQSTKPEFFKDLILFSLWNDCN